MKLGSSLRTLAFASVCALPLPAGVLTFNFTETGGNVVVTASGSITDNQAWVYAFDGGGTALVDPLVASIYFGGLGRFYQALQTGGSWTGSFGPGGSSSSGTSASSFSNDALGFTTAGYLLLPSNYSILTPTALSSTMTFTGATFTSLGITTGSYVFNNGGDTIQLTFGGGGGSSVPDAGPGPALVLLLGGLGLRQWRSSRRARAAA
jgi:hypothetical protein